MLSCLYNDFFIGLLPGDSRTSTSWVILEIGVLFKMMHPVLDCCWAASGESLNLWIRKSQFAHSYEHHSLKQS